MVSKLIIRDLSAFRLDKTDLKCVECSFWFDYNMGTLLEEISNIKNFSNMRHLFKSRFYNKGYNKRNQKKLVTFVDNGGIVKGAYKDQKCVGLLIAGDYRLFPKLQSFNVFPPGQDSTFLGCIYVEPQGKGQGIEKRLLMELEKDLLKKNTNAIETIGKRLDDDVDKEEFENSPLVSFKFLINNGFYLKKNDSQYPLLRLDLKSIDKRFSIEKLTNERLVYKKAIRDPVVMRGK